MPDEKDTTQREQADDAALTSAVSFQLMAESMPQMVFTAAPSGTIEYANPQWTAFTGVSHEDLLDQTWTPFIHPDDVDDCLLRWRRSMESGEPFECEVRYRRADGAYRWHLSRARAVRDTQGVILTWIGSNTDIDDQKRVEAALHASEAQLAADLADMARLQEISGRLIEEDDIDGVYTQILRAAIALMRADCGSMQLFDPERNELHLLAWTGFDPAAAAFWGRVHADASSTCAAALASGRRVIVPDIEHCEFMAGTDDLRFYRLSGIRAVQSTPLVSRGGQLIGMISTHWHDVHEPPPRELDRLDVVARQAADLLERHRSEQELAASLGREQEARAEADAQRSHLHALLMQTPAAIGILRGPNHVYELANGPYLDVVGRRDILGKPIREALPELEGQGIYELFDRAYTTGEPFSANETLVATDRGLGRPEEGYFNVVFQPFRDEHGAVAGVLVLAVDVTEEVLARRQVEHLAAEREAILGQIADGVVIADAAGRTTFVNAVGQALMGVSTVGVPPERRSEVYGLLTLDGEPFPTEELPTVRAMRERQIVDGVDMRIRRPDGTGIAVQVSAAPIIASDGTLAGSVVTFRDVSAQRALEGQREDFLSAATHDLKTPIAVLQGQAQLLRRRAERGTLQPEGLAQGLQVIEARSRTITTVIDDLMDVARLRMGQPLPLNRQRVDLVRLVRGAVRSRRTIAGSRHIVVETTDDELTGDWDAGRLTRVVGNLLDNAVKFSPEGSEVTVRLRRDERLGEPWAVVTVTDRGTGISAGDLSHIFDWFYRAQRTAGTVSGSGIGLAGAQQIVALHGGTIAVESQDGGGSTFTIRLPLHPPNQTSGPLP